MGWCKFCTFLSFLYICIMYKSKLDKGTTFFSDFKVKWSNATQEELKKVYELGYTNLVSKEEDAKPKKTTKKAKAKQSKDSDKE